MSKPLYVLSSYVEEQFATLLYGIAEHSGWKRSMDVEESLYAAFRQIGLQPGIGHTRSDLASRNLLFFYAKPYYILYLRGSSPVRIVALYHSARDVAALLDHETSE